MILQDFELARYGYYYVKDFQLLEMILMKFIIFLLLPSYNNKNNNYNTDFVVSFKKQNQTQLNSLEILLQ